MIQCRALNRCRPAPSFSARKTLGFRPHPRDVRQPTGKEHLGHELRIMFGLFVLCPREQPGDLAQGPALKHGIV